jgi:hypothetical protein
MFNATNVQNGLRLFVGLAHPYIWRTKLVVVARFREEICRNHVRRNVGGGKQGSPVQVSTLYIYS